ASTPRQDVLSEQEFLKAPPSPPAVLRVHNDIPRPSSSGVQLALFMRTILRFWK
ncbi:hypothetical protein EVAR_85767_1, partial [Eumeta japonica]